MALSIAELERGVKYWRRRPKWNQDFHNEFYRQLSEENPQGNFTAQWWQTFLPRLQRWVATRGKTHAELTANAEAAFPDLARAWQTSVSPYFHLDIAKVTWAEVAAFPTAVAPIKGVQSPVFTSKFCHFLAPSLFPVVDNAAMGGAPSYQRYFQRVQAEWSSTPLDVQHEIRIALTRLVESPLAPGYPVVNKGVELCLIGRRH